MKKKRVEFFLFVLLFLSGAIFSTESDTQSWFQINQTFFLNQSVSVFTEIHPRISLSEGELSSLIARAALQYQIGAFQLGAGSLWQTTHFPGEKEEIRHFLQGSYTHQNFLTSDFSHRIRLEQRRFNDSDQDFHRFRYQLRSTHSWLHSESVRVLLANEIFFNLDSPESSGLTSGFDQNRFFSGINIRWSDQASSDLAYLFNYVKRPRGNLDLINHIIFYSLNINFS